jgi:hypothetical protein
MVLMVSMDQDYVYELLAPTGLLFVPQVMHEYGEHW